MWCEREEQVSGTVAAAHSLWNTRHNSQQRRLNDLQKLEDTAFEDWMRILAVDLLGAFYFIKHAFLNMPKVAP